MLPDPSNVALVDDDADELAAPDWLYAAGSGNPDWILTDNDGGTALDIAKRRRKKETAAFLEEWMHSQSP